jgi:hypothetical protein
MFQEFSTVASGGALSRFFKWKQFSGVYSLKVREQAKTGRVVEYPGVSHCFAADSRVFLTDHYSTDEWSRP